MSARRSWRALAGSRSPWVWVAAVPGTLSLAATILSVGLDREPSREEGLVGMVEVAVLCVLLAGIVRWAHGPQLWVCAGLTASAAVAWIIRFLPDRDPGPLLAGCAFWSIPTVLAAVAGAYPRLAATRTRDSVERARAEQRRDLERDLHDYVSHDLTGMIVQAQAARFAAGDDPRRLREALHRIEVAGQRAMDSMDRALELLRDGEAWSGRSHRPGLSSLEELVTDFGRAGATAVSIEVDGPLAELPREVDETLYRVCVESLTNVRRHAPDATEVLVAVLAEPGQVALTVTDRTAPTHSPARRPERGGTGLRNARARVEALGGTLVAGPYGAGWRVRVAIPL